MSAKPPAENLVDAVFDMLGVDAEKHFSGTSPNPTAPISTLADL